MAADDSEPQTGGTVYTVIVFFLLLLIVAGAGYGIYLAFPKSLPTPRDPNALDLIFGSSVVIFAARLLLFAVGVVFAFAAVYIASSVVARMRRGEWLQRAGWFEAETETLRLRAEAAANLDLGVPGPYGNSRTRTGGEEEPGKDRGSRQEVGPATGRGRSRR